VNINIRDAVEADPVQYFAGPLSVIIVSSSSSSSYLMANINEEDEDENSTAPSTNAV
jgi:hypothetical protein